MAGKLNRDPPLGALIGVAGGAFALAAALVFQYGLNLPPCPLCIDQRWAHGAAIAVSILALLLVGRASLYRVLLGLSACAYLCGAGIALYHAGIEQKWWLGPQSCTSAALPNTIEDLRRALSQAPIVLCDRIPWSFLGVSIAGYNAIFSAALAAALFGFLLKGRSRR